MAQTYEEPAMSFHENMFKITYGQRRLSAILEEDNDDIDDFVNYVNSR